MKSIIPSKEVNATQNEISDWNDIPTWAVGLIEYRDGGRFWISNDGLRLEEVGNPHNERHELLESQLPEDLT